MLPQCESIFPKVSFLKPRHCFLAWVILWFAGGDFVLTEGILTSISNKPQISVVQIIDIYFLPHSSIMQVSLVQIALKVTSRSPILCFSLEGEV